MRRYACRHAHGNAACPIGQQVREQAGHDLWLFIFAIIGWPKIGRIFVKPAHQLNGRLCQPRFGISVSSRIVAVDIAKIALAIDQRIAQGKCLREADHRIIHRLVAMRVIFTNNITDDPRAFLIPAGRIKLQQAHGP